MYTCIQLNHVYNTINPMWPMFNTTHRGKSPITDP